MSGDRKHARRTTGNEDIYDIVYEWFKDATSKRLPVSGPFLFQQALKFASDLGIMTFKAPTGWLAAFLKCHNIVFGTMSRERSDVNKDIESWRTKLPSV